MAKQPDPPKAYQDFVAQFPKLGDAWDKVHDAGNDGPLDRKTARLAKLAVAVGAMREGAVRASVRKAAADGVSEAEIMQVVALATSSIGFPSSVAAFCWVRSVLDH